MTQNSDTSFAFAEFEFELNGNILFREGVIVPLEPVASRVLRFLLENGGRLVLKDEILSAVWSDVFTTEDVLKRAVSQIRKALGEGGKTPRFIETHHRRGYRFLIDPKVKTETQRRDHVAPGRSVSSDDSDDPNFDCFVGRESAIEFLDAEFRRVQNSVGQPILLVGEPGIGKTQTSAFFAKRAESSANALSLRIRFFDYEASFLPPLNVFLDLLGEACRSIFGVSDGWREHAERELKISLPDELFENRMVSNRHAVDVLWAVVPIAEAFVRLSRLRPLILIFDDIQWADLTSQKIIGHLMRTSVDSPLMIIGLTRRGELEDKQSELAVWLQKQAVYRSFTTFELAPLVPENCRVLMGEIFRGRFDPDEISGRDLAKLHGATGGNPYFFVETVRLLINEKVIEKEGNAWHWRGLKDVPLPETARMAARAKLSAISREALDLVECAAVLGDTFLIRTLLLMHDSGNETAIENAIDETIAAQILSEQDAGAGDDCQFYHTTLRRAVYLDLSPRRRKRLHSRAIRAIETSHHGSLERFAGALAAHAEAAEEFEKCLGLNLQAARAAAARFDWLEAAELVGRAERVVEKGKLSESLDYMAVRGEVFMSVGRRAEAERILSAAVELTDSASVRHNLGKTRILLGKYREAIEPLEKSLESAIKNDDKFGASAALIQIASAKYALCDYDEACEILQGIIEKEDDESYNRAVALGKLGWIRALQCRYAEGKELLKSALEFHRTAGDMRERAVLSMCLNWCEYGTGDYEAAVMYAQQARNEAKIVGEPYNESVAMMRIAKVRIAQGLYEEAEDILAAAYEQQKTLEAPHARAETIWTRGRARLALRKFEEAADDFRVSLEIIRDVGDRDDEFRILNDQAALQNTLGNYEQALQLSQAAAEIAREIGVLKGVGESLIPTAYSLEKLGRCDEALSAARESVRLLEEFEAGELWQACFAVASVQLASQTDSAADSSEIESSLRRSVELLESIRSQFSPEDTQRSTGFTSSMAAPAKALIALLVNAGRKTEAQSIRKTWNID